MVGRGNSHRSHHCFYLGAKLDAARSAHMQWNSFRDDFVDFQQIARANQQLRS